jgi:hypothetical protein
MPDLGGTAGNGIEHFKGWDQFAGTVDLDSDTATTHLVDQAGKMVGASTQAGKILRPGRYHFPLK